LLNKDILQPYIGLFFSAGAEIYRRCDMPSHALDCLRKALAVYRCAPVDVCRDAECVRDMELWMRVAGLSVSVDRVTDEIERTEARIKARVDRIEPLPPSVYVPSHFLSAARRVHAVLSFDVPVPSVFQRTVRVLYASVHRLCWSVELFWLSHCYFADPAHANDEIAC
jgi:hypothetical protein